MDDKLFADLLAGAAEMVAIEQEKIALPIDRSHQYDVIDVKAIRMKAGKNRKEFAEIIGASYDAVTSWENNRRNPTGTARKLLGLINTNPSEMIRLLKSN